MFSDLEKDKIRKQFSLNNNTISLYPVVRKYQNKCSKKGVTTKVKIFHKLLHRDCSD